MASSSSTTSAPDPSLVLFARGVIARLSVWPALRLAVDQSWGGPESAQKRTWIASVIVDSFDPAENAETPDADYIEETLLQIMADEYDAVLEDGSAESVAKEIMQLWSELKDPKSQQIVEEWERQAERVKGKKVASQVVDESEEFDGESGSEDDGDEDEDMEGDETPQLLEREQRRREEPEVDGDGFTVVKGKAKGHK